ncbi:MAG: hypothetical protein HRU70_03150 [Phycisphaeraceae bacterium]|nr:MAG: hypothetical protein HRU70_03150 [Phycisphaeraceae bacterium]
MAEAIFFDDGKGLLSPLIDLRASFDVRTGALTSLERLTRWLDLEPIALLTHPRLADLTRERHHTPPAGRDKPPAVNTLPRSEEPRLFINGRCPLPHEVLTTLEPGQSLIESGTGDLIACVCPPGEFRAFRDHGAPPGVIIGELDRPALLARPWDVIRFRDACLSHDLEMLADAPTTDLPPAVLGIGDSVLTISPSASVYPGVTLDLEHGPIVIADHATVRPGATIVGPASIGAHSTVLERALIKAHTAIGPWCKVSGEIGGTIFQGFANKAHDGHLGDAWVGEWVNLGAGTTNSNLLNTYSEVVAAAPGGTNERTGLTFLGAVIGDHVKAAIATRIMTGAVLGTGGMFARSAPIAGTTPPLAWWTDEGQRAFRPAKFIETALAMMARRKITPTPAYTDLLRGLAGES